MQILFKIFQPLPCFPTQSVAKGIKLDALHLISPITTKTDKQWNSSENALNTSTAGRCVCLSGLVGCFILGETGSCLGNFGLESNIWILSQGYIFFVLQLTKDSNGGGNEHGRCTNSSHGNRLLWDRVWDCGTVAFLWTLIGFREVFYKNSQSKG